MFDNDDNLDTALDLEGKQPEDRGDEVGELPPEADDLLEQEPDDKGGEGEEESDEPAPASKGSKSVPHARFNEVNEALKQERAERLRLEEELARARGAQQPSEQKPKEEEKPVEFDFKAARKQLREAIYEGDDTKAEQIEEEIDRQTELKQTRIAEQRAQDLLQKERAAQQQADAMTAVESAVAKAYESYPFLDIGSDQANQDAIDEVVALRDLYISRGKAPAVAIVDAVAKVAPRYAGEPVPKADSAKSIQQNLERERRIPPMPQGVGERARKVDYEKLSEDEWDRLSDDEKRRARGDFVG